MSVCQHLFKRVDLIKSNPGGFCFILYFNIIFQVVPAVTVNKDIPRRRKSFPKRGKERLLPLLLRNSCGSENPESTGIHILHHLPDDFAAAGMTPAFKDHDHRHACISSSFSSNSFFRSDFFSFASRFTLFNIRKYPPSKA